MRSRFARTGRIPAGSKVAVHRAEPPERARVHGKYRGCPAVHPSPEGIPAARGLRPWLVPDEEGPSPLPHEERPGILRRLERADPLEAEVRELRPKLKEQDREHERRRRNAAALAVAVPPSKRHHRPPAPAEPRPKGRGPGGLPGPPSDGRGRPDRVDPTLDLSPRCVPGLPRGARRPRRQLRADRHRAPPGLPRGPSDPRPSVPVRARPTVRPGERRPSDPGPPVRPAVREHPRAAVDDAPARATDPSDGGGDDRPRGERRGDPGPVGGHGGALRSGVGGTPPGGASGAPPAAGRDVDAGGRGELVVPGVHAPRPRWPTGGRRPKAGGPCLRGAGRV